MHCPVTSTTVSFGRLILLPPESFRKYLFSVEYAGMIRRFVVAFALPFALIAIMVYVLPSAPIIFVSPPVAGFGVGVGVFVGAGVFVGVGVTVGVLVGVGVFVGVGVLVGVGVGVSVSSRMSSCFR